LTTISPYISFVVTSRNDDHGCDLLRRMQLFVDSLIDQCKRNNLQSEIVLVEWNPPSDRPRLSEALVWPTDPTPCDVRIIEVPAEIHRCYNHSDKLPLFQMIAKNVGIQRAQGQFILATNIDILFSDELIEFLAEKLLKKGKMYRVDRYDVPSTVPNDMPFGALQIWCQNNIVRLNRNRETIVFNKGIALTPKKKKASILKKMLNAFFQTELPLHTNACGDFTLMAKDDWMAVRGYAEFEMFSFKIDGLLCCAAHYAGAKEILLEDPMRIYHIEHSPGSGWTPDRGAELMKERITKAGIPQLSSDQYQTFIKQMQREKKAIVFNKDEDWGLANETLNETIIKGKQC